MILVVSVSVHCVLKDRATESKQHPQQLPEYFINNLYFVQIQAAAFRHASLLDGITSIIPGLLHEVLFS